MLNEWLSDNDFETTAETADSFEYDLPRDVIYWTITKESKFNKMYLDLCADLGLIDNYSIDTMSFLHELGHAETLIDLDDKKYAKAIKAKANLKGTEEEKEFTYYNLYDEKEATLWAIDFANNNKEATKKLEKIFEKIKKSA